MQPPNRKPLPRGVREDPIDRWGTRLAVEMTYGTAALDLLDDRKCPSCKQDIPKHIGVGIEAKEYSLSGLCPKCQRRMFKPLENEAGEPDWVPPEEDDVQNQFLERATDVKEVESGKAEAEEHKSGTGAEQGTSGTGHRNPRGQRY